MKNAWMFFRISIMLLFFAMAVHYNTRVQESVSYLAVSLSSEALSAKAAEEILEKESEQENPLGICFWGEVGEAVLGCKETGQSSSTNMVLITGNPELAFPGTGLLTFQSGGCFLDTETAWKVFGTKQASGQIVWYGDRAYIVCGTFESLQRIMICQATEQDGRILDMLSAYQEEPGRVKNEMEQFLLHYGMSGTVLDNRFLAALINNFLLVLPAIFGVRITGRLLAEVKRTEFGYKKIIWIVLIAGAAGFILYFLSCFLQIPSDMIPSRWSDFSFWSIWWNNQRENLLLMLRTAQGETQLTLLWNILCSFTCSLCAIIVRPIQ